MKSEVKICQNCKKDFTIEPDDFELYSRFDVPSPVNCWECRIQHLYAYRNERKLYRRNCDLCGKSTVTIYSKNKPFKVFCPPCFWSDKWDAKEYAKDFDFSRPFFEQFRELQLQVPRMALLTKNSVNSEYTNHAADNRNCYLSFAVFNSEDVFYSSDVWHKGKDIIDCSMITDGGTLAYECVDCQRISNCQFCFMVRDSIDCFYSYDLRNCMNCFMCSNLRNKSYCIFNKQYTKEEYDNFFKKYNLSSRIIRDGLLNQFKDLLKNKAIHKYGILEKSINSVGNNLYDSKNAKYYFDANDVENSRYSVICPDVKDSIDNYHVGLPVSQLIYKSHGIVRSSNIICCHLSYDNTFISYCDSCHNSNNLFGCISIKKGEYCILNKQYSKEEYQSLLPKIIEHMKKNNEWGEFFPKNIAPVCYNETLAQVYLPLEKEQALEKGFLWADDLEGTFGKETISQIPDDINVVDDNIVKEIFRCEKCSKNYNITPTELLLYKKMNIPIPIFCSDCRYLERISLRLPYKLWHRTCMCDKKHPNHEGKCDVEFETSYAPERPEIIYCEKCYQQEVY